MGLSSVQTTSRGKRRKGTSCLKKPNCECLKSKDFLLFACHLTNCLFLLLPSELQTLTLGSPTGSILVSQLEYGGGAGPHGGSSGPFAPELALQCVSLHTFSVPFRFWDDARYLRDRLLPERRERAAACALDVS